MLIEFFVHGMIHVAQSWWNILKLNWAFLDEFKQVEKVRDGDKRINNHKAKERWLNRAGGYGRDGVFGFDKNLMLLVL